MHELVKIIADNDGDETGDESWHFFQNFDSSPRTVCGGEVFGDGEGEAVFKTKTVARGGITCRKCLKIIKEFKAIKL
jgi:hypothetical protein